MKVLKNRSMPLDAVSPSGIRLLCAQVVLCHPLATRATFSRGFQSEGVGGGGGGGYQLQ